jgi:cell wall-associated NlpC family hydrolase
MTLREAIVAEARTWIGTKYSHQQRMKGVAVDCAGLVIGVSRALGLVDSDFDITGYARTPDGSLLRYCDEHMTRIGRNEMQPGDALVVKFDADPQHFGILAPYPHSDRHLAIIHAASNRGRVIETRLLFGDEPHAMKFVAAFKLPNVID